MKFKRAAEAGDALYREMGAWFSREPDRVVGQVNDEGAVVPVLLEGELPDGWPLLVSDCLQNFRSMLDHLSVRCAERNVVGRPSRLVDFTITESVEAWDAYAVSEKGKKTRRQVGADAWDIITDLQPHVRWLDDVEEDPLWGLNKLARVDRHQHLHLAVVAKRGTFVGFGPLPQIGNVLTGPPDLDQARFAVRPSVDHPSLARLRLSRSGEVPQEIETYSQTMFDVVFDPDGEVARGHTVQRDLWAIAHFLHHHVLPRFAELDF